MKRLILVSLLSFSVVGCSTINDLIPSFWDDNQSASIINIRQQVEQIDCAKEQTPQVTSLIKEVRWFQLYSESKGQRQQDVLNIVAPIKETTDDWLKRGEGGPTYCKLKKQVLEQQSKRAAEAIMGRF